MKKILLFFACLALSSCLIEGTDTGNPGIIHSNPGSIESISVEMDELLTKVCTKLVNCGNLSLFFCESSLLNQTNIDTEIGLLVGEFENLIKVDQQIFSGNLIVSQAQLNQCTQDIDLLNCSDPEVQNAYSENASNPYEGVADMLPLSCETIL